MFSRQPSIRAPTPMPRSARRVFLYRSLRLRVLCRGIVDGCVGAIVDTHARRGARGWLFGAPVPRRFDRPPGPGADAGYCQIRGSVRCYAPGRSTQDPCPTTTSNGLVAGRREGKSLVNASPTAAAGSVAAGPEIAVQSPDSDIEN